MKTLIQGMVTAAALSAGSTFAVPITVDVIGANRTNVTGGSNINYYNNDGVAGNEEIRWGNPH